ncbi:hypothetical protein HK101_006321 [Irineochytrium annulatum]|nr:hypothetical protein HK101_006321 [Irineochytrium annulatum]
MHAVANKESMTRTQLRMMKHMSLVQLEPPLVGPASNRPVPTSSPKRPLEPPDVVHFAVKSALAEEDMVMDEKEA